MIINMSGITRKQQRLIQEYIKDLNGYKAAIRAGYSPKTAKKQGHRLLDNPILKAAIDLELAEAKARNEITKDYLTLLLKEVAEDKQNARNSDRINAIVTLAKMHGHLVDARADNSVQTVIIKQIGLGAAEPEPIPTLELQKPPILGITQ